ncbi:MAG: pyridoxal phosphate-dependent aminotransferase [Alphaproteobacteria bacterium]|nr:pyridoxal phosphate-dependent aminotransferase [Alphaproteobacteria bacterium]
MSVLPASAHPFSIAAAFERLGTETAFEVLARAKALEDQGRSILNLGIGQPDFPTPEHIVDAAIKALRDGHHGYTGATGILALREAVCRDLDRRLGVRVSPEQVVIVPGGKVTMYYAISLFGQPGVEVLYPNPGFPIYESLIKFTGATPVPIPLEAQHGFAPSAAAVLERITPATRLLILNSPANPTGGVMPASQVAALAAGLAAHPHVTILSDEIYGQLIRPGHQHKSLLACPEVAERTILLDGWSKTYAMTGWRLGYGVWPRSLVATVERIAVNSHSCVNTPAQFAGIAALDGPQDCIETMRHAFDRRQQRVVAGLNALPGWQAVEPAGAFYAFPSIAGLGLDARTAQRRLLEEAGIATIAGTSFGSAGEGHIRLSCAAADATIEEALARIAAFRA